MGKPKPVPLVERRVTPRRRLRFTAEVQAAEGRFAVLGLDLHEHGAMLVSRQAWPAGTILFLDLKAFWLMGFARVRHCTVRDDCTYGIGLEFCAPLMRQEIGTWQIERICPV